MYPASEEKLYGYLSSLTVHDLTQDFSPYAGSDVNFRFEKEGGASFAFSLWSKSLYYIDANGKEQYYYVIDTVDTQALAEILVN